MVLPQHVREGLVDAPGEVLLSRTADGVLLRPTTRGGTLLIADDGLPVLVLDHAVSNDGVLAAIQREREGR